MTVRFKSLLASLLLPILFQEAIQPAEPAKPKLVVAIIIDQFRYDYLTRFRSDYHGGLNRLLDHGADFTNAFYAQVPTVTAVGHSIFMSGAMPAVSGIVGNSWYERNGEQVVTSVCDWNEKTVGAEVQPTKKGSCTDSDPASPRRLLVSTLGDELRMANPAAKVIGVSIKARGAILPSGHHADGAFWFDDVTGNFVSSTYYMDHLPNWATSFNAEKRATKYVDQPWDDFPKWNFHAPSASGAPYSKLPASPWGNELIEGFAESAINGAKLGQTPGATDLLTISYSSNDYVGHAVGPDAPEVRDMAIRTDALLGKLFGLLDKQIGMNNVIVVLSADHGVATRPGQTTNDKTPGGYIPGHIEEPVQSALNRTFGKADWLLSGGGETSLYFNWAEIQKLPASNGKRVSEEEVYRSAEDALFAEPQLHVARVYTRRQLESGVAGDLIAEAEMNGFFPRRSGDLMIVFEPGYLPGASGTTHFSPYAYDRHVPVLFMGPRIKPGRYDGTIRPNDIAPTLATMLDVQTPSGSSGRVLSEMINR